MPFGRFKGQPLHTLSDNYVAWLAMLNLREPLASAVWAELAKREGAPAVGEAGREAAQVVGRGFRLYAERRRRERQQRHRRHAAA